MYLDQFVALSNPPSLPSLQSLRVGREGAKSSKRKTRTVSVCGDYERYPPTKYHRGEVEAGRNKTSPCSVTDENVWAQGEDKADP